MRSKGSLEQRPGVFAVDPALKIDFDVLVRDTFLPFRGDDKQLQNIFCHDPL